MILYRYYRPEHALLVLRDLEIRTSIPNTLNDPFELSPNIDAAQFNQERCETFLRQDHNVDMWYRIEGADRGLSDKDEFKRWYLNDVPRRAAELLPKVANNVEQVRKNFADDFSSRWRLICASRVPDSILMWSHYAANHTGIVIGFDMNQKPFSQIGTDYIMPVVYSETKADYVHCNVVEEFEKALFAVATTKALPWGYEEEVRIILAASPKTLRDSQYLPISPAAAASVYLGCRSTDISQNAVDDILTDERFDHVQVFEAKLHSSEYLLQMKQVR